MMDIRVQGMTCDHCVQSVRSELMRIDGVRSVSVDLVPGETSVVHVTAEQPIEFDALVAAIDEAGYDIAND